MAHVRPIWVAVPTLRRWAKPSLLPYELQALAPPAPGQRRRLSRFPLYLTAARRFFFASAALEWCTTRHRGSPVRHPPQYAARVSQADRRFKIGIVIALSPR